MYKPADYIKGTALANIYPVANKGLYKDEKYVMLLAHLLKYYKPEDFAEDSFLILDNGLYEELQVSTDVQTIIDKAEAAGLPINEFIVPDVLNEVEANIKMFESNIPTIKKYIGKYNFMFVAQSTTPAELKRAIDYINQYKEELPNLSVGFSKLTPMQRDSDEVIEILKTCKYPIHVLGIKLDFAEVFKLKGLVRGVDSSQLPYIVKNESSIPADPAHYTRSGRREDGRGVEGVDIELETDVLDDKKLREYRDTIMPQLGFER